MAGLLDPETPVDGVTAWMVRPELKAIGVAMRAGGGQFTGADYDATARWGITGQNGVTMPGPGKKVERPPGADSHAARTAGAVTAAGVAATASRCPESAPGAGVRRDEARPLTGPGRGPARRVPPAASGSAGGGTPRSSGTPASAPG